MECYQKRGTRKENYYGAVRKESTGSKVLDLITTRSTWSLEYKQARHTHPNQRTRAPSDYY